MGQNEAMKDVVQICGYQIEQGDSLAAQVLINNEWEDCFLQWEWECIGSLFEFRMTGEKLIVYQLMDSSIHKTKDSTIFRPRQPS